MLCFALTSIRRADCYSCLTPSELRKGAAFREPQWVQLQTQKTRDHARDEALMDIASEAITPALNPISEHMPHTRMTWQTYYSLELDDAREVQAALGNGGRRHV